MSGTRKGDDGVFHYTPRSPDDVDGVLSVLSLSLFLAENQNLRLKMHTMRRKHLILHIADKL